MKRYLAACILIAAVAATGLSSPAMASDPTSTPVSADPPSMTGSLSLYGLLPWYDGKAGVSGLTPAKISGSPADILDHLKFTFMANGEVRWDKIGIYGDLIYLNVADTKATPGPLFGSARVQLKSLIFTPALTYQLYGDDTGWIQGVAGARVWAMDTNLKLSAGVLPAASATKTISWADPVIGLRARQALSNKMFLTGTALIGGFGAGSDFMWDVFAGLGYRFSSSFSITGGFRGMGVDYSDSGDVINLNLYGPQIFFSWDF